VADLLRCPRANNNFILIKSNMKNQFNTKSDERALAIVERKNPPARNGTKTCANRYERRKIREQLRHLDWALAGVD
jgi:hypothetical protein